MPDVVLSNDDVTVLSSPETIELLVDIGPTGTRGSKFFVGTGDPNDDDTLEPLLNDLYVNVSFGSSQGYLYQYVSEPGGDVWVEVLNINPAIYSKIHTVTFASGTSSDIGSGTILVPITDITEVTGLAGVNFNVQYSIVNANPLASSISSVTVSGTDLVVNLQVSEYDGTWGAFDSETDVHLFVSVVI